MKAGVALVVALAACTSDIQFGGNTLPDDTNTGETPTVDRDGDGYSALNGDCDETNADVHEGASETCDGLDNDCGGTIDVLDVSGVSACTRVASYEQFLQVDVLFVVDTTVSMSAYLPDLSVGARDILEALVGQDYLDSHIGVISMDIPAGGGELLPFEGARFLSGSLIGAPPMAHPIGWAQRFLDQTIAQNDISLEQEEGRGAVSLALSSELADGPGAPNADFLRDGAHLVIVFLSSDEDHTIDPTVDALEAELALLKGSLSNVTIHAIVQDGEFDCYSASKPDQKGYTYQKLAQDTAGTVLSICQDASYAGFFEAMGQNSAYEGLATEFALNAVAKPDSVEVTVVDTSGNGRPLEEFALADNGSTLVITADPPPSAGSIINILFEMDP